MENTTVARIGVLTLFCLFANICGVAARCPSGFVYWGKSCYKYENGPHYSWTEASVLCRRLGAKLVTIDSASENYWVKQYTRSHGVVHFWINLNDLANEGHWVTGPETPTRYTKWCSSQPDNHLGVQNCAFMLQSRGCWDDAQCWHKSSVLCEAKLKRQ